MQVVLVGDFFQLPPVSRGGSSEFAFEHPSWKEFRLATCVLEGQFRQGDDPLLDVLGEIRNGDVSEYSLKLLSSRKVPVTTEDHTELFTHNAAVDSYNTERLDRIRDDIFVFDMMSQGAEKLVESLKK
jgi:ATP-dependent DNA helicase PIF1